ncbi:endothelial lipase-like [Planococcus citri]|uniref:endothelial lipase-like n=1 Tax=Planococcus citri TaxID=170843 RepID=UPI0031F8325E
MKTEMLPRLYIGSIFLLTFNIKYSATSCLDPPQDCLRKDISFHLYTEQNSQGYELVIQDSNTIEKAPFLPNANFKILIHGYTQNRNTKLMVQLREEYFKQKRWNIIVVDYAPLAEDGCYIESTFPSAPIVGKCSASMLNLILDNRSGIRIDQFHVVGFSMGAQIAAELSINLGQKRLPRITGLDPAWPLFYPILTSSTQRLGREHADFVDVIHTNSGGFGVVYSLAHYDIYANDGTYQPGCGITDISCSHSRAMQLFIESINTKNPFIAYQCSFWEWTSTRICRSNENSKIIVGEHATPPKNSSEEGIYQFRTNDKPPFSLGQQSNSC